MQPVTSPATVSASSVLTQLHPEDMRCDVAPPDASLWFASHHVNETLRNHPKGLGSVPSGPPIPPMSVVADGDHVPYTPSRWATKMAVPGRSAPRSGDPWPPSSVRPAGHSGSTRSSR